MRSILEHRVSYFEDSRRLCDNPRVPPRKAQACLARGHKRSVASVLQFVLGNGEIPDLDMTDEMTS